MYFFLGYVHKDVLICRAWCNAWIMDVSILQSCKVGKVRLRCALRRHYNCASILLRLRIINAYILYMVPKHYRY